MTSIIHLSVTDAAKLSWEIENFSNPSTHLSPKFVSSVKKLSFHLLFDVFRKKTRVLLQCKQNERDCVKESKFKFFISMINSDGHKVRTRIFESNPSDRDKFHDYSSYEICKRQLKNNNLAITCLVDIIEEVANVKKAKKLIDLSDDFGSLLTNGTLSDMTLSTGGKDFRVHKIVLAARSSVFAAMFEHKDTREVRENRISIEDMSSDVCEEMLKHIYTGCIPSNMSEYAFDLFVAADKYQLTKLKLACEEALVKLLDIDTVCSVLLIADGCNAVELKSKCINFITMNAEDVMKTEGWKLIKAKTYIWF